MGFLAHAFSTAATASHVAPPGSTSQWEKMIMNAFKKTLVAIAAAATLGATGLASTQASAEDGYGYGGYGGYGYNSYPSYGYNSYPSYGYNSYPSYGYNSYGGYGGYGYGHRYGGYGYGHRYGYGYGHRNW
jgi:hypothetical protein